MDKAANSHLHFDRIFKTVGARLTLALRTFVGAEVGVKGHGTAHCLNPLIRP